MYSRNPYTAEFSACFHLISFSFIPERLVSIRARTLVCLHELYPNIRGPFVFLLPSFGKILTSMMFINAKLGDDRLRDGSLC